MSGPDASKERGVERPSRPKPGSEDRGPRGPRQTKTYLKELFAAQGLRPRRELGQNFLIDLNLLDVLVRESGVTDRDAVLEVGAGTGALTTRLAETAGRVVAVEVDRGFFQLVEARVANCENVTLINRDVLAGKNRVAPEVLGAVRDAMRDLGVAEYHLVANLPFDVAAVLVGNLLLDETPIRSMTVTVQFEVGQRLAAEPGTKHYGSLSVLIGSVGAARILRTLPPTAFWPRPKVTSAIVRIDVEPGRGARLESLRVAQRFVRDLFMHRRKNLRSAIARIPGYKQLKPRLNEILRSVGLSSEDRAEQLTGEQLRTLFDAVRKASKSPG